MRPGSAVARSRHWSTTAGATWRPATTRWPLLRVRGEAEPDEDDDDEDDGAPLAPVTHLPGLRRPQKEPVR